MGVSEETGELSKENLLNWILDQGHQVTVDDIIAYIQKEVYYEGICPMGPSSSQDHPMSMTGLDKLMMPDKMPTVAPGFVEGNLQYYTTLYPGESSHSGQHQGDNGGNDMETEAYPHQGHIQQLNQSGANKNKAPAYSINEEG